MHLSNQIDFSKQTFIVTKNPRIWNNLVNTEIRNALVILKLSNCEL